MWRSFQDPWLYLHDTAVFPADRYEMLAASPLAQKAYRAGSGGVRLKCLERCYSSTRGVPWLLSVLYCVVTLSIFAALTCHRFHVTTNTCAKIYAVVLQQPVTDNTVLAHVPRGSSAKSSKSTLLGDKWSSFSNEQKRNIVSRVEPPGIVELLIALLIIENHFE